MSKTEVLQFVIILINLGIGCFLIFKNISDLNFLAVMAGLFFCPRIPKAIINMRRVQPIMRDQSEIFLGYMSVAVIFGLIFIKICFFRGTEL